MHVEGKQLWVTGAASGIGAAITGLASEKGAQVVAADISPPPEAIGRLSRSLDVSSRDAWQALRAELGSPDVLCLNAGVMSARNGEPAQSYRYDAVDQAHYERLMGVNVDGVVFGLQTIASTMQPGSVVVVTASLAALHAYPFDPLYAMSKHAVVGLVKSLASEFAEREVRLLALCPDRVTTDLLPREEAGKPSLTAGQVGRAVMDLVVTEAESGVWALPASGELQRVWPGSRRTMGGAARFASLWKRSFWRNRH